MSQYYAGPINVFSYYLPSEKWDIRFLELAKHISEWSYDPSTRVGAVVAVGKKVLGVGYNGFSKGVKDLKERYEDRDLKYKLIVHAEVNALIMSGEKAQGASLYVYPSFSIPCCCSDCAKMIIQYGIREVVGYFPSEDDIERAKRWAASLELSKMMLNEASVFYRGVKRNG